MRPPCEETHPRGVLVEKNQGTLPKQELRPQYMTLVEPARQLLATEGIPAQAQVIWSRDQHSLRACRDS